MEILRLEKVNFQVNDRKILCDISFSVNNNEVISFTGTNGSGKSSLLKFIVGDFDKNVNYTGNIFYKNSLVTKDNFHFFLQRVGYVSQDDSFFCSTVYDELLYSISLDNEIKSEYHTKVVDLLKEYDIGANCSKNLTKTNPAKLSGGEKRLISILKLLIREESLDLYIIDEPFNNLDFKVAKKISNAITSLHLNNANSGILMVTHCKIIPCINTVITLKDGKILNNNIKYEYFQCLGKANQKGIYE